MQDPVRTKLARALVRLDSVERWGADPARSASQRQLARLRARVWRVLIGARQEAVDREERERQKLLRGDPDCRSMFLGLGRAGR